MFNAALQADLSAAAAGAAVGSKRAAIAAALAAAWGAGAKLRIFDSPAMTTEVASCTLTAAAVSGAVACSLGEVSGSPTITSAGSPVVGDQVSGWRARIESADGSKTYSGLRVKLASDGTQLPTTPGYLTLFASLAFSQKWEIADVTFTLPASLDAGGGTTDPPDPGAITLAPVWSGSVNADLLGGAAVSFAAQVTDPDGDPLTTGIKGAPGGVITSGKSIFALSSITEATRSALAAAWIDDGKDPGEVVSLDVWHPDGGANALLYCGQPVFDGDFSASQHMAGYVDGNAVAFQAPEFAQRYASGNKRAFAVRALLDLPVGTHKRVSLRAGNAPAAVGSTKTLQAFRDSAPNVTITFGGGATGTFTLAQLLALASPDYLDEGPACCEVITNSVQIAPGLRLRAHAVWIGGGAFGFRLQAASGSIANIDKLKYTVDIAIAVNGTTVASSTAFDIWPESSGYVFAGSDGRFFEVGGLKLARFSHDAAYYCITGWADRLPSLPHTTQQRAHEFITNGTTMGLPYLTTHTPGGAYTGTSGSSGSVNNLPRNIGVEGLHDTIGLWPRWDTLAVNYEGEAGWPNKVASLLNGLEDRYQIQQRRVGGMSPHVPSAANNDAGRSWQFWSTLHSAAEEWAHPGEYPNDKRVIGTPSGYHPATHAPDDAGCAMQFGDPWVAEQVQFQALHNFWQLHPQTRRNGLDGILVDQGRGIGWGIRTLVRAWLLSKAGTPLEQWLRQSVHKNIAFHRAYNVEGTGDTGDAQYRAYHRPRGCEEADPPAGRIAISGVKLPFYVLGWCHAYNLRLPLDAGYQQQMFELIDWAGWFYDMIWDSEPGGYPYQHAGLYFYTLPLSGNTGSALYTACRVAYGSMPVTPPGPTEPINTSIGYWYTQYALHALEALASIGRPQSIVRWNHVRTNAPNFQSVAAAGIPSTSWGSRPVETSYA